MVAMTIHYPVSVLSEKWWPNPDLNRGPADYETQTEPLRLVTLFTCLLLIVPYKSVGY
jgi:hypothetical protein